jgi:hypothetical protein
MPTPMPRADLELLIRRARLQQADDDRLFVSRRSCADMLDIAYHNIPGICQRGELITGEGDERFKTVWVPSIYDFMVKRLIALGDPDDPPADARDVLLPQPLPPDDAEAQAAMRALIAARQEARQATEALIKETRQATDALSAIIVRAEADKVIRQIVLLALPMPNGKEMAQCTGAEMAGFGVAYQRIAKAVGPKRLVGAVLDEEGVRRLIIKHRKP